TRQGQTGEPRGRPRGGSSRQTSPCRKSTARGATACRWTVDFFALYLPAPRAAEAPFAPRSLLGETAPNPDVSGGRQTGTRAPKGRGGYGVSVRYPPLPRAAGEGRVGAADRGGRISINPHLTSPHLTSPHPTPLAHTQLGCCRVGNI